MHINTVLAALRGPEGRDNPYPYYTSLHRTGIASVPTGETEIYSVVAHGYEAAEQALRDPNLYYTDAVQLDSFGPGWRQFPVWTTLTQSMMFNNPPTHTRLRRQIAQVFTPRRIAALEPAIVDLIGRLLDRMAELGAGGDPVDFMAEFAFPLPSDVIGAMLGVPEADRPWFRPLVEAIGAVLDLGGTTMARMEAANDAALKLREYFLDLAARRRVEPADDLVSSLVEAGGLTDDELVGNLVVLFNAGFATTTHMFGNGLLILLDRPELTDALRDDPSLAPGYVNEILRYDAPVQLTTRWAVRETEVAGFPVPEKGRVLILLGAGNRDPRRFPDPDSFDPSRPDNVPLSFGGGIHYCIGAALSRLEGHLAFPMLLRRFPKLALAGAPVRGDQLTLRGHTAVPVSVGG